MVKTENNVFKRSSSFRWVASTLKPLDFKA
jgi:hypothetical protein